MSKTKVKKKWQTPKITSKMVNGITEAQSNNGNPQGDGASFPNYLS